MHHHALLWEGERALGRARVEEALRARGFELSGNPDFILFEEINFSVEAARTLKEWAYVKAVGTEKAALLMVESMTLEAQNALLKVFEEPPAATSFHLVMPSRGVLLPTLLSRVMIEVVAGEGTQADESVLSFVNGSLAERLELSATLAKAKESGEAKRIVERLIAEWHDRRPSPGRTHALRSLLSVRSYLDDRSPSLKQLLEYTAVVSIDPALKNR